MSRRMMFVIVPSIEIIHLSSQIGMARWRGHLFSLASELGQQPAT